MLCSMSCHSLICAMKPLSSNLHNLVTLPSSSFRICLMLILFFLVGQPLAGIDSIASIPRGPSCNPRISCTKPTFFNSHPCVLRVMLHRVRKKHLLTSCAHGTSKNLLLFPHLIHLLWRGGGRVIVQRHHADITNY